MCDQGKIGTYVLLDLGFGYDHFKSPIIKLKILLYNGILIKQDKSIGLYNAFVIVNGEILQAREVYNIFLVNSSSPFDR